MPEPKSFSLNWASIAQGGIVALLAWCLVTAHSIDVRTAKIEVAAEDIKERMITWHTPNAGVSIPQHSAKLAGMMYSPETDQDEGDITAWTTNDNLVTVADADAYLQLDNEGAVWVASGYYEDPAQGLAFLQKSVLRAWGQLDRGDLRGAKKTLLLGLADSGMECQPAKGGLECD